LFIVSVPLRGIGSEKLEEVIENKEATAEKIVSVPLRGIGSEKHFIRDRQDIRQP